MFKGKNVAVTGGSRGIGRAIVAEFASQGADVWFTYRSNDEVARTLTRELAEKYPGQHFTAVRCDAANADDVRAFFDEHLDGLEQLDVLVNNAGITQDGLMAAMTLDQWSSVIDTNLTGVFTMTQQVLMKLMLQRSGAIVNVSSVAGVYGNAGQVNYAAAKSGLIGMTKSLSKEVVSRNIRVNALAPGFIDTDMTSDMTEKAKKDILGKIGMKRMGMAADIANAVTFLASDRAAYITGQTLVVDGGLVL
ncbi:3-oxoacyl-[acyl-carrier-protein] reductase [Monaibacterium marinum]|uniref:3-oxoacyl-[acyl-carrier-protein] reductase n=1 Tax=Pontivivens marinum TaxID=1690039 RepID=A0A2C9CUF4_9RHOB|nr:3-oxoacyl-[acyl-carrier-protein] reductase [Monaibacterium marinum]SOH94996.1 3-oxoacyl-[acyl-carrier-protein] reductase [Monaibacterium marinum]